MSIALEIRIRPPAVSTSKIPLLAPSQQTLHTVSHHSTQFLAPTQHIEHHPFIKTPFKMDIPRFDVVDALGWILKTNQFF